jgi:hypothetical protein
VTKSMPSQKAAIEAGHPEAAGAAVICFEWLQRPENVLAGCVRWTDYRSRGADNAIRIEHHKTAAVVLHPLETMEGGERVQFYADAESVLAQVPRRGVPMILKPKRDGTAEPYTAMMMAKVVRRVREAAKLPPWFTLDSCRHGGMTELEEAELTDGRGERCPATEARPMRGMPSARSSGLWRPHGSVTRTGSRTPREQLFRMGRGKAFRMRLIAMTPLLLKRLAQFTYRRR